MNKREFKSTLIADVHVATAEHVEIAYVDQGYTGEQPAADASKYGVELAWSNVPLHRLHVFAALENHF